MKKTSSEPPKKDDDEPTVVERAKKRFEQARSYYADMRQLAKEDTKFVLGDGDNKWQWDEEVVKARQGKPCLTVNITAQHCNQIINAIRQNRPAGKVIPGNSLQSSKEVAEILEGLVRSIHTESSADTAHDEAAKQMVYGGEGYWRVVTEYENDKSNNQKLVVKSIKDPNSVLIDPGAIEPDKCDAEWVFVFEEVPIEKLERMLPDQEDPQSWDSDEWCNEETVRVAEYYELEFVDDEAVQYADGTERYASEKHTAPVLKRRKTQRRVWNHYKLLGGMDEPAEASIWPGQYHPIICVEGETTIVDGKLHRKGLVRDLKDANRMVNMNFTSATEVVGTQTKAPWILAEDGIEGHKDLWARANAGDLAYLLYNHVDESGNPIPPPHRVEPAHMPEAQVRMLELSVEQMRAASGQQNANFGIRSDAQSGIGIQRLKQQGEIATFHYPDNHARALKYEIKVILDATPKVYDTRRVLRIVGIDGAQSSATIDPEHPQPYTEIQTADAVMKIFNPNMGEYSADIDVGPNYETQRQEAADRMNELAAKNPAFMQIAGDLYFKAQDYPMADELAERWAKTLPPNLQDQKGQDPAAQLSQQVQGMTMHMQEMQQQGMALEQQLQQVQEENAKLQESLQRETQARMKSEIDAKSAGLQVQAAEVDVQKYEALLQVHEAEKTASDMLQQHKDEFMQSQAPDDSGEDKALIQAIQEGQKQTAEMLAAALEQMTKRPPLSIKVTRTPTGLEGVATPEMVTNES